MSLLRYSGIALLLCATGLAISQVPRKGVPEDEAATSVFAVFESSMGSFEIELFEHDAPRAVENFTKLAEKQFFDGTRVHRISRSEGFIQMGDDKSKDTTKAKEWGTGGRSIWGKEFQDEIDLRKSMYRDGYKKGTVAMASRGAHMNTSQFFVMFRDAPYLPRNYTIFGRVVKGQDVVDAIGRVEVTPLMSPDDGRPKTDVVIRKVIIRKESALKSPEKEKKRTDRNGKE